MLDLIHRYRGIIKNLPNAKITILDIGGGEKSIRPFVDGQYNITSADVEFRGKKMVKTVKTSADKLPFKNKSFDVVVSIDALEHFPKEKRRKSIQEMLRVARKKVILACPCGKESEKYEIKLIKFARKLGKELPWLEEHQKEGLPEEKEILAYFGESNIKVKKNCNLTYWYLSHFINTVTLPIQRIIGEKLMFKIYGVFSELFNFGKCYRKIFIVELI